MALAAGVRLGPYEIVSSEGAGGMGEVYRARDTRLNRTVAIKVLRPHLAASPELRQRFEREARAISSLNHPNICTLHDVGQQSGLDYLVMEYVEGETLAKRLGRGALPPEEVLRCAIEMAGALEKAHRQGITHRDLKPGNIMLTKTGAKLLDFGLARLEVVNPLAPAATVSGPTQEPEVEHKLTAEGAIVGTFQYMAPEQLEGKPADARTDIFALGTVIYEMATGRPAFSGRSKASLIAAILDAEPPPLSMLQPMAPPALERVVKTCLAKDPDERWQTAHDVKLQLQWIAEGGSQAGVPAPVVARRKSRERLAWAAAGLLAIVAGICVLAAVSATSYVRRVFAPARPLRSSILPPENAGFPFAVTLSPDGTRLAYHSLGPRGNTMVWVYSFEQSTAQPLAGTEGGVQPFWSPDGRSIGFRTADKLKRIEASGGPATTLGDTIADGGAAWGPDGTVLFSVTDSSPLYRVPASGGLPAPVTRLDESRHEISHRWPFFLPDGRHFLYLAMSAGSGENDAIFVASLDGKTRKLLVRGSSNPAYAPRWPPPRRLFSSAGGESGYLLFVSERNLMAAPLDARTLELTGEPAPVAEQVPFNATNRRAGFSISNNGLLAYLTGTRSGLPGLRGSLVWVDRGGKQIGSAIGADYYGPRLSPDARKLVSEFYDVQAGNISLWVYTLASGAKTRFTFGSGPDSDPVWAPDGSRIVFSTEGKGGRDLYQKDSSGAGRETPLLESAGLKTPTDWSSDGRFIAYTVADSAKKTKKDIWILPLFGDRRPFPFLETEFDESEARFSPDGRWIAYVSNESRKEQVYVAPFAGAPPQSGAQGAAPHSVLGGKMQISTAGGTHPEWRGDGKELFYLDPENKLMGVEIRPTGPTLEMGVARALFEVPTMVRGRYYEVAGNGQRFLLNVAAKTDAEPLTLVVNWMAGLRK